MNVLIEVSLGSNLIYKYCSEDKKLKLNKILSNSNIFPFNFGIILDTLNINGSLLNGIIISNYSFIQNSIVKCKIIGGIDIIDENGPNDMILLIPDNDIDILSKNINTLDDLNLDIINKINYFLKHYKDKDDNKYTIIKKHYSKDDALKRIQKYKVYI